MKKYNLFLLLTWVCSVMAYGQSVSLGYIYVKSTLNSALPACSGCVSTNEAALNTIFNNYRVTGYSEAFPGAVSPTLVGVYRIDAGTADFEGLERDLESLNLFDVVELVTHNLQA